MDPKSDLIQSVLIVDGIYDADDVRSQHLCQQLLLRLLQRCVTHVTVTTAPEHVTVMMMMMMIGVLGRVDCKDYFAPTTTEQ